MLTNNTIWKIAEKVRAELNLKTPINYCSLENELNKLGINCEIVNELESKNAKIYANSKNYIIKHTKDTDENMIFDILKEFGHLLLHCDSNEKVNLNSIKRTKIETFENTEFAASIIMPVDEFVSVSRKYTKNGFVNIEKVAKHFQTTMQATIVRGKVLGVWNY